MGYPMTYSRVVKRNHIDTGGYNSPEFIPGTTPDLLKVAQLLMGDLRRLETDQQDETHIHMYAAGSGATEEQVRTILREFFAGVY